MALVVAGQIVPSISRRRGVYSKRRRVLPRVVVGSQGQRVEYDLEDLEQLVLEDAERRLREGR